MDAALPPVGPKPWRVHLLPAIVLGLAACGDERAGQTEAQYDPAPGETPVADDLPRLQSPLSPSPAPPPGYTDGSGVNENYPDLTPTPLASDLERTEAGARNVLLAFARAIELREYDQAWSMLDEVAREKHDKAAFNALFAGLSDIVVAVPGGEMEGAAGSSYYTSNAEITAVDAAGRPVRLEGPLVLRRVNDVPGASAEQLRWRLDQIDLTQTH